ncbi:MAG TPA: septal ring lytic transglycosylase RlpA family protein [Casimicrobiaceae bacterium]|nr:septal ring lytic transglycosylase RlpA family protein [Casimicrobiaceae bacterium]
MTPKHAGVPFRGCAGALLVALLATGCAQQPVAPAAPYPAVPKAPAPPAAPAPVQPAPPRETPSSPIEIGRVSLYGAGFAGKKTASGERFDPAALTMAHRTPPFGTRVRVTNLENHRSVEVRVNDRGPAVRDRIADVSLAAARKLGMTNDGVIEAALEVIEFPGGQD